MSDDPAGTHDSSPPEPPDPRPTRAQQRRAEEFERLCNSGYTVCCGGGPKGR